MATQLETILAHTAAVVAERRGQADVRELERRAAAHQPRGFEAVLRNTAKTSFAVVSELKKASPSKGLIRADFNPAALAGSLEAAGAAALSVLTDEKYFQGSLGYLEQASASVRIPCLRKDFMVDDFQMLEARAHCADAVLLIVAALSEQRLKSLRDAAIRMELDILCEVHDREELNRAVDLGFSIIGVNSRNLHTMEVQPQTQLELGALLPATAVRVAESGLRSADDLAKMSAAGYSAFLVGESLMREADPAQALKRLLTPEPSISLR